MARRKATRLSPKALLRLRSKLVQEGYGNFLFSEDTSLKAYNLETNRPEDTIENRIRPISDSLVSIKNPDELAERVKSVLIEGPVVPIPGSYYMFRYMAKTPEIRFDLNPLVQVTEVFSYGFIGYNFHWGRNRRYTYPEVQGGLYQVTADELKDLELIPFQNFQMKPPK